MAIFTVDQPEQMPVIRFSGCPSFEIMTNDSYLVSRYV